VEELFQEISGYGGAVFGGAANVVDWAGFGEDGNAGGSDSFLGDGLSDERSFGGVEAGRIFAQTGCTDAYVLDMAFFYKGKSCYGDLGDGLGVARAYFADISFVTF